jgi:enoyl-CoA hydratase
MSVRIEKRDRVTTVIIDRPHARNAIDPPTASLLAEAFRSFDNDRDASVAVLCGAGGTFCAGADLKAVDRGEWWSRIKADAEGPIGPTRMLLGKPVIAAIDGFAVAGGLELAAWCDLRIVERGATLGVFCRRFGVPLVDGGTVRLERIVGLGRALDLILTGRAVSADEALRMGLATRVVDDGTARQVAEDLARELASFPQACMRHDRLSTYEQHELGLDAALRNEYRHGLEVLESGEPIHGAARFSQGTGRHGEKAH